MFRNFFKLASRNITRHKSFSLINIAGLTLGLTTCLLIGIFVWDEKQFDKKVPGGENVYRIFSERTEAENVSELARTPPMVAPTLLQLYPEVENATRIFPWQSKNLLEAGETKIYEADGYGIEPDFFEVFPMKLTHGSVTNVLKDPKTIIITETLSKKLYGTADPVGKELKVDKESFTVRAVLKDEFEKFHLPVNYFVPVAAFNIPLQRMERWSWQQFFTYVKLKPGSDVKAIESKFLSYTKEKVHPQRTDAGSSLLFFFQPLKDIHLHSAEFKFDVAKRGNILYVKALSIVAIFILLIACFNFVNLATASSLKRAKEVGVRKSIGASRKQLIVQFTGETILLAFISVLISVVAVFFVLPLFNSFTEKDISYNLFLSPAFISIAIGLSIVVGMLAGLYPAFILSSFQPVRALKGLLAKSELPGKIPVLRHALVVVQFSLSALLIISAIVVFKQVQYLHNKELGFNKEEIMFFPMRGENMTNNYQAFKNELLQSPGVSNVSIGYGFPGDLVAGDNILVTKDGKDKDFAATQLMVDHDYIKTLGLQVLAGRDFSREIKTDETSAFIINETAVKELGLGTTDQAIGKELKWPAWNTQTPDSMKVGRVIGVVKDFNYKSLYDKVGTAVLQIFPPAYWKVAVKMKTADITNAIAGVKNIWNKFSPDFPLEYNFLDESFAKMYKSEDKLKALLSFFTGIAIFIGCLGLFGLATFSAQLRIKEIGIRKVLGASVNGIVYLLSKDFIKLVLIALTVASPIAWYFMNEWLKDFAYRINIEWWIFALAAFLSVAIALITVSFQAIKSAIANPVKSLRIE